MVPTAVEERVGTKVYFSSNVLRCQAGFGESDVELSGQDVCGDLPPMGTFGGQDSVGVRLPRRAERNNIWKRWQL